MSASLSDTTYKKSCSYLIVIGRAESIIKTLEAVLKTIAVSHESNNSTLRGCCLTKV